MNLQTVADAEVASLAKPFFIALSVSAISALPILHILVKLGSKQTISEFIPEHAQKQGTPTMGGLIILAGLFAGLVPLGIELGAGCLPIFLILLLFAVIGFIDDYVVPRKFKGKRGLGWLPKLGLQILAFVVPTLVSVLLDGRRPFDPFQWIVCTFVILFFVNAFNFADGMDGLAGGLLALLSMSAICLGVISQGPYSMPIGAACLGAVIPFLWLNAPPAKVFMGDVGSMPLGALLGLTTISSFTSFQFHDMAWGWILGGLVILNLVLVAELVPVPLQIISVKLTGKRLFPKTPIHHAFQSRGVAETRIVWGFLLVQLIASVSAVLLFAAKASGDIR